ncbi:MAG: prenyltransferase [Acidobacteria bacterium]|nr:prenyltransferase [Acidobacteriota bacterium]
MGSYDLRTQERSRAIAALLSEISSDWYGAVSLSVYETARLVMLAPWLAGHRQRLLFLLERQHQDGTWSGPDGYGLVPTLSATEALLSSLRRWPDGNGHALDYGALVSAVDRGLQALFGWLRFDFQSRIPDTVAAELVIPALVEQVNTHLDRLASEPLSGLGAWCGTGHLVVPSGVDGGLLARLRDAVRHGEVLPTKVLHSLEAIGPVARGASFVHPVHGAVGCSPAATATWLDGRSHRAAVGYLEAIQQRGGGPVPGVTPITVFERVWVLAALTAAGIHVVVPPGLLGSLHAACGEFGASAGAGLCPDSDDTAGVLWLLAQWGTPRSAQCLWPYKVGAHFSCFLGERTPSTSTNAHILQAFCAHLKYDTSERFRYPAAMDRLAGWLLDRQEAGGNWWDKWHASPYYATACCAIALYQYRRKKFSGAVRRAVEWLLDSQQKDGSWGRWGGTWEETAYALRTLLQTAGVRIDNAIENAAVRGGVFLQRSIEEQEHVPLWHGKDLYTPSRVVRAEGLAALHLAYANPRIAARIDQELAKGSEQDVAE